MILGDLFSPRWQHSKPEVRLAAINEMTAAQTPVLARIVISDSDADVRSAALGKIDDLAVLRDILANDLDVELLANVRAKVNDHLRESALQSPDPGARDAAMQQIDEPQVLAEIAASAPDNATRAQAIRLIHDESLLARVLEQPCGKETGLLALARIHDPSVLARAATRGANKAVRRAAAKRIETTSQDASLDPASDVDQELDNLCTRAEALAESTDWQAAQEELQPACQRWEDFDPEGRHALRTRFDQAREQFFTRLREHEELEAATAAQAAARAQADAQRNAILGRLEAVAAEALADGAQAVFDEAVRDWREATPLPDAEELDRRFDAAQERFTRAQRQVETERATLAELETIGERLEALAGDDDLDEARELRRRWRAHEAKLPLEFVDADSVVERIKTALGAVDERLNQLAAAGKEQQQEVVAKLEALCALVAKALDEENRGAAEQRVKQAQANWRRLAADPNDPATKKLAARFAKSCKSFFASQQSFYEEKKWERWANKALAEEVCGQVEALATQEDTAAVARQTWDAQARWKKIGSLPQDDAPALKTRFRDACQANLARCETFFQANLEAREKLCLEAEQRRDSTKWQKSAARFKAIQQEWKELGPTPRSRERELVERFRAAADDFFERRRQALAVRDEERGENLKLKEALCERADALAEDAGPLNVAQIKKLQAEWREVGPAPRDRDQQLWRRFRTACDRFFGALDAMRVENQKAKEALCQEVADVLAAADDDAGQVGKKLSDLQGRWKEIGPAPRSCEEELQQTFRRSCDQFFEARRAKQEERRRAEEENQTRKEALLGRLLNLGASPERQQGGEQVEAIQRDWQEAGPGLKARAAELQEAFDAACLAFTEERWEYFDKRQRQHEDDLRQMEELCARVEALAGVRPEGKQANDNQALSLAEELHIALESNFLLDASKGDNGRAHAIDDVNKIQKDWKAMSPLPCARTRELQQRFQQALDAFFARTGKRQKPPPRRAAAR